MTGFSHKATPPYSSPSSLSTPSTTRTSKRTDYAPFSARRAATPHPFLASPTSAASFASHQHHTTLAPAPTPTPSSAAMETLKNNYAFPTHRLRRTLSDPTKTPLCVVACGSFSPITYMHLRMFEMALDHSGQKRFEIVGGYLSPVGDGYKKRGLASAVHRIRMCELAAQDTSNWIMVDPWEALQMEYQPTATVLDHFEHEINEVLGGVETETGEKRKVRIVLLAGSDLVRTMGEPGVWSERDLNHILTQYGCFIIERSGSKLDKALEVIPQNYHRNIYVIRQPIANDVSSTKIRDLLSRGMSVNYLLPSCVVEYIRETGLYKGGDDHPDPLPSKDNKDEKDSVRNAADMVRSHEVGNAGSASTAS